jgi:NAD(P)-dependent dehydrogenase (short-subunit alcohol dehydrogenase family)
MGMAPHDLEGKVVLITGATDGLGRGLARAVAGAGGIVLVHGRSQARIDETLAELPGARGYRADLSSLEEVRRVAGEVRDAEPRLDVLVNNAGIGTGERELSQDGYELRFAVNYLSGFLLTQELLPAREASAPARIVNVASAGQMPIDFDDVMLEHDYSGVRAYCQSKLAQVMFTVDLAGQMDGKGLTVNSLHPATYMPTKMVSSPVSTLEEGVEATLRLVTDPDLDGVSGRYFNGLREAAPDPQADDPDARRRLWELSERLVGSA